MMNAKTMGLWFGYGCVAVSALLVTWCMLKLVFCDECSALALVVGDSLLLWGLYRIGLMR